MSAGPLWRRCWVGVPFSESQAPRTRQTSPGSAVACHVHQPATARHAGSATSPKFHDDPDILAIPGLTRPNRAGPSEQMSDDGVHRVGWAVWVLARGHGSRRGAWSGRGRVRPRRHGMRAG
jgi:hypothetical protein